MQCSQRCLFRSYRMYTRCNGAKLPTRAQFSHNIFLATEWDNDVSSSNVREAISKGKVSMILHACSRSGRAGLKSRDVAAMLHQLRERELFLPSPDFGPIVARSCARTLRLRIAWVCRRAHVCVCVCVCLTARVLPGDVLAGRGAGGLHTGRDASRSAAPPASPRSSASNRCSSRRHATRCSPRAPPPSPQSVKYWVDDRVAAHMAAHRLYASPP
jgi:hypothetical protein